MDEDYLYGIYKKIRNSKIEFKDLLDFILGLETCCMKNGAALNLLEGKYKNGD